MEKREGQRKALQGAVLAISFVLIALIGRSHSEYSTEFFDYNTINHFLGWFGANFILLSSLHIRRSYLQTDAMILSFMLLSIVCCGCAYWLPTEIISAKNKVNSLLVSWFSLLLFLVGIIARRFRGGLPLIFFLCITYGFSIGWEVIWQPFIGVYDGPARGYVQWDQVFADIAGISLALCMFQAGNRGHKVVSEDEELRSQLPPGSVGNVCG